MHVCVVVSRSGAWGCGLPLREAPRLDAKLPGSACKHTHGTHYPTHPSSTHTHTLSLATTPNPRGSVDDLTDSALQFNLALHRLQLLTAQKQQEEAKKRPQAE